MSLDQIARRHGTDKSSEHHNYCPTYERYFEPLRNHPIILLELGIGGYDRPGIGGHGLKTWEEYFHQGKIYGVDNQDKSFLDKGRIKTFCCGQDDPVALNNIIGEIGFPDIIIDDASHVSPLTIKSFQLLFPLLKVGGIYVIEDVHASYWPDHGYHGGTHEGTTMNYFKRLADSLNASESKVPNGEGIKSIQFWEKLIFVLK